MKILIEESVLRQALEALEGTYALVPDGIGYMPADISIRELRTALDATEKVEPSDCAINSMDAAVWAKAFADRFTVWSQAHGVESDTFGLMVGWFANAIMAGYDEAVRRHPAPAVPSYDAEKWQLVPKVRYDEPPTTTDSELRAAAQTVVEWYDSNDVQWIPDIDRLREALK